ncbi:MAG: hypothetical protein C0594_04815 [Marinilabiliales bacterium]|nr:MAG: hypothetical protein C0594_04815 [Marinilabiliales bacterium]
MLLIRKILNIDTATMMMTIRHIGFLIFFMLFSLISFAQYDFQIWANAEINKELTKDLSISFSEELRLENNARDANVWFSDIGLNYEINKNIEVAFAYRYINEAELNYTSKHHRFYGSLSINEKINRFQLSYRIRYQQKYSEIFSSEDGKIPSDDLRNRIKLEYNIRKCKLTPSASYELYYKLNYRDRRFRKAKYTLGVEYKTTMDHKFGVYYRIEQELNRNSAMIYSIVGITYAYKF